MAAALTATAAWAYVLLRRTPSWHPWLATVVLLAGLALSGLLLVWSHLPGRLGVVVAAAAVAVALMAPAGYTLATVSTPHGGAIPSAGPSGSGGFGPGGGPGAGGRPGAVGRWAGGPVGGGPGGAPGGAAGGLLNGSTPAPAMVALLEQGKGRYRWVAAAVGSNTAAGYQLATGSPVMPIGGFNGTDPSPTPAQFQRYVAQGRIHYFVEGGRSFGGGGATVASQITTWVQDHFPAQTVGGVTVYDLTAAPSAG